MTRLLVTIDGPSTSHEWQRLANKRLLQAAFRFDARSSPALFPNGGSGPIVSLLAFDAAAEAQGVEALTYRPLIKKNPPTKPKTFYTAPLTQRLPPHPNKKSPRHASEAFLTKGYL